MANGRVNLGELFSKAKVDDSEAVEQLFRGFLAEDEVVSDCGYLGSMGFVFKEHSFWCVTPIRVCSMRVKSGGEMNFTSAYIDHINSDAFYQPSTILLWIIIIVIAIPTFGLGLLLTPLIVRAYFRVKKSGVLFWCREGIPIYVFADRNNLRKAQRIAGQIANSKRLVGA